MKNFLLVRNEDETGVSGVGIVAEGVILPSGKAIIEWLVSPYSMGVYGSLEELIYVHGHHGKTFVKFV